MTPAIGSRSRSGSKSSLAAVLAVLATFAVTAACESEQAATGGGAGSGVGTAGNQSTAGSGGGDTGPSGCDIQAVMAQPENGCTNAGCHGARFQGGLDLLSPGVEARLLGAPSQTDACSGQKLVDPDDVENSLMLRVIDPKRFASAPCGVMMPFGNPKGVSPATLACFEQWVTSITGKPPTEMPVEEFEPVAASSYVNKVKTLVTGSAASAEEIALVQADGAALRGLLATWLETPEFAEKISDFLRVALQQKVMTTLNTQFNVLRGSKVNSLRSNLQESFVRTAVDIVQQGRPFTEVLTTRRWAATTATLSALAYLDRTATELQAEKHTVFRDPGPGLPTPPLSLKYSVENHVWHLPTLPETCNLKPLNADSLFEFLLGFVNCFGAGQYKFDDTVLTPEDFNDWRFVNIQATGNSDAVPLFYDLDALRGASSIRLRQPRMGFMNTPAFFANWETNEDNQFRVTTSQSVIVALGKIFSPADATVPVRLDGLAKEHAQPGTACYGCHQFLDPMREYFAQSYSFTNQRAEKPGTITPSFAFQGHIHDGGRMADFAAALAEHPKFASGWTQKLCYWANSQACDESDPEFARISKAFTESSFDFKTLLIELLSSPLVTGAKKYESAERVQPFVSITRKQHLCQLLDARLGVADACGVASAFAGLVPEDEFNRGSAEPVQTAVTGLFHYAAVEKLCSRLATRLVGTTDTTPLKASEPEVVLDTLTERLMGLGVGTARHDEVRGKLGAHFKEAKAASNPLVALRSAFVVACVSPEVQAVGL